MGPGLVMVIVLLVIAALFVGGVITVAMQLVSINAMGQWFCRFDVNRWGTSSAPLPDGVPAHPQSSVYGDGSIPQQPSDASQQPAQPAQQPVRSSGGDQVQQSSSQSVEEVAGEAKDGSDDVAKLIDVAPEQSVEDGEETPHQAIPLPPISEHSPVADDAGKDDEGSSGTPIVEG